MNHWKISQLLQWQLLLLHCCHVLSGNIVTTLPGFHGQLPFKLETGYVSVEGSELFYYFLESEGNPQKDPFMLWFSGGPGCSSSNGLIDEIGPIAINVTGYDGGIPNLQYVDYSWTKWASILFVDSPVGAGFSYALDPADYYTSDSKWAAQNYIFLKKWLMEHPKFLKNQLFIGADSYAGIPAPLIIQAVLDGNKAGDVPHLNLKGYVLGSPVTERIINGNSKITFDHRMGLISDELYQAAKEACDGNYFYQEDTSNVKCTELVNLMDQLIRDIYAQHLLEPNCIGPVSKENKHQGRRSDLQESSPKANDLLCRQTIGYSLEKAWANNPRVRKALHVREGTVEEWVRCNESLAFTYDLHMNVLGYHRNFTKTNLAGLVYNGDHDPLITNVGTQEWIKTLNLTVEDAWRPWFVDGEVAGYTELYEKVYYTLCYATIKGAGHTAQETKRREAYFMFKRWIHYFPL